MTTQDGTDQRGRVPDAERRRRLSLLLVAVGAFVAGSQIVPLVRGDMEVPLGPILAVGGIAVCALGLLLHRGAPRPPAA